MSSAAFIAFALCFVAGPLAYALLLRLVSGLTARLALALAGSTVLAIGAGALAFTAVARLTGSEDPSAMKAPGDD